MILSRCFCIRCESARQLLLERAPIDGDQEQLLELLEKPEVRTLSRHNRMVEHAAD